MIEIYERLGLNSQHDIDDVVELTHEQRERGRMRLTSQTGQEVRVFLDRGKTLEVGEILKSTCGKGILVQGAVEEVTMAHCRDWHLFARACYHLGNRHVKLEVGDLWLRIKPDHVLEEMLHLLGLETQKTTAVFCPESGAYSGGGHHHGHGHDQGHVHGHDHGHSHAHGPSHVTLHRHGSSSDHDCGHE